MKTLLIIGSTSDIARATGLYFQAQGWNIILAGRNEVALQAMSQDFSVRSGKQCSYALFDTAIADSADKLWANLTQEPDAVLCAVGLLGDQEKARHDMSLAQDVLTTNLTGLVPLLSKTADVFEKRGHGAIIGISSVAGERGRASNYVYGAAKAGFTVFLSGLRNRLCKNNVHVMTVNPGFVATRMTEGMNLPALLTATPEQVARDIYKALHKKKNVLYTKWFWRYIMLLIKLLPESVFKKLSL